MVYLKLIQNYLVPLISENRYTVPVSNLCSQISHLIIFFCIPCKIFGNLFGSKNRQKYRDNSRTLVKDNSFYLSSMVREIAVQIYFPHCKFSITD